ncbi:MAG: response regulator [Bacteroidia bacterium]|nr:response regulator [Bacteroidia bacterium]
MKLRLTDEVKVALFFLFTTLIVVATGILAFRNLSRLSEIVRKSNTPELKLLLLKGVNTDISSAESSVKSFALTSDPEYLQLYKSSLEGLGDKISKLDTLTSDNPVQHTKLDSMGAALNEKISLLEGYVSLEKRGLIINELNLLAAKLDEKRNKVASEKEPEAPKANIFKKLFSRKEKKKEQKQQKSAKKEDTREKQLSLLDEVKSDVSEVKKKQSTKLRSFDTHELSLTQRNKLLSDKIRGLVTSMEVIEIKAANDLMVLNEQRHKDTNRMIAIFSMAASLLLFTTGWIIFINVRKRKEYEKALINARNEAENYSSMQEIFLANMSHEIRTPMNAISGFTDQVLQTNLSAQQRTYLDIVRKSVTHLLVIINDILDYSRLKAGKLVIEHINFSPKEVITDAMTLMSESALKKDIALELVYTENIPPVLNGDPARLRQIVINLIGNSVKFTKQGKVVVEVKSQQTTAGKIELQFKISDTGIGIEQENLKRIFDAFEQAHTSTSRTYGGSGLGLSITKKLIEIQQGTIEISSIPGSGTTVQITLPYTTGTELPEQKSSDLAVIKSILQTKRILIADDEEWNIKLLQAIFNKLDIRIQTVNSNLRVLELMEQEDYDLVILDLRMPELDGIETTRKIRTMTPEYKSLVPVIILTASANNRHLKACKEAGVNAIITKPFNELDLLEKMVQVTEGGTFLIDHSITPFPSTTTARDELYNLTHLKKLANNDEMFLTDMIQTFVNNLTSTLEMINQAITQKQPGAVADAAHKICPPCRFIEANTLLKHFKMVEKNANEGNMESIINLMPEITKEADKLSAALQKELTP